MAVACIPMPGVRRKRIRGKKIGVLASRLRTCQEKPFLARPHPTQDQLWERSQALKSRAVEDRRTAANKSHLRAPSGGAFAPTLSLPARQQNQAVGARSRRPTAVWI